MPSQIFCDLYFESRPYPLSVGMMHYVSKKQVRARSITDVIVDQKYIRSSICFTVNEHRSDNSILGPQKKANSVLCWYDELLTKSASALLVFCITHKSLQKASARETCNRCIVDRKYIRSSICFTVKISPSIVCYL